MRKSIGFVAAGLLGSVMALPAAAATHDVVFGSTWNGGTLGRYTSNADSVTFTSTGWGTFQEMIVLNDNSTVVAGVSHSGGSLMVYDGTTTAQPTTGWGTWQGLTQLGSGNILHASTYSSGSYSVQSGTPPYGYAGGWASGFYTINPLITHSNGTGISSSSVQGGTLVVHSVTGLTSVGYSNGWGAFEQLVELSNGHVLAGTTFGGGGFAKFDGSTFGSVGIANPSGWGTFEQMVSIGNGRAVAGVTHLGGTLVMYDGNANQINTGWGTFEQMIALSNGDVLFGSTLAGGTLAKITNNGTSPQNISTGQGTFYGMVELDNGNVLIADGQGSGAILIYDGTTLAAASNGLGWGEVDQIVSIGDGEAMLGTAAGDLLHFDGSTVNFVSGGWGTFEQMAAVAAVPEPASLCLLGVGGLAMLRRRAQR